MCLILILRLLEFQGPSSLSESVFNSVDSPETTEHNREADQDANTDTEPCENNTNNEHLKEEKLDAPVNEDSDCEPPQREVKDDVIPKVEDSDIDSDEEDEEREEDDEELDEAIKNIEVQKEEEEIEKKNRMEEGFKGSDAEEEEEEADYSNMPEAMRMEESQNQPLSLEQSPPSLTRQMPEDSDDEDEDNDDEEQANQSNAEPDHLERMEGQPSQAPRPVTPQSVEQLASPPSVEPLSSAPPSPQPAEDTTSTREEQPLHHSEEENDDDDDDEDDDEDEEEENQEPECKQRETAIEVSPAGSPANNDSPVPQSPVAYCPSPAGVRSVEAPIEPQPESPAPASPEVQCTSSIEEEREPVTTEDIADRPQPNEKPLPEVVIVESDGDEEEEERGASVGGTESVEKVDSEPPKQVSHDMENVVELSSPANEEQEDERADEQKDADRQEQEAAVNCLLEEQRDVANESSDSFISKTDSIQEERVVCTVSESENSGADEQVEDCSTFNEQPNTLQSLPAEPLVVPAVPSPIMQPASIVEELQNTYETEAEPRRSVESDTPLRASSPVTCQPVVQVQHPVQQQQQHQHQQQQHQPQQHQQQQQQLQQPVQPSQKQQTQAQSQQQQQQQQQTHAKPHTTTSTKVTVSPPAATNKATSGSTPPVSSHQGPTCGSAVYSRGSGNGNKTGSNSLTSSQSLPPAPPSLTSTTLPPAASRGFADMNLTLESPTSINSGEMTNSSVETTPSQNYSDCAQVQNTYCTVNNNSPGNYMDTVMTSPVNVQMSSPANSQQQNFSIPNPSPSNNTTNFNMHNPSPSNNANYNNMPMPSPNNTGSNYNSMPIHSPSNQNQASSFGMPMPSPTANTSNNFNMPNPSPNNSNTYTSMPTPSPTNSNHSFNMATPSPTATGHATQNYTLQNPNLPNPPMQNAPMPNPTMQNSPMHNQPMPNPTMQNPPMPNGPMSNPPMPNPPMPNPQQMQPGPMPPNMGMQHSSSVPPTSVHSYGQRLHCNPSVNAVSSYGHVSPHPTQRLVHSSHGQPSSCQMSMGPGGMGPGGPPTGAMGPGHAGLPRSSYSQNNTSCSLAKLQQLTNGIMDIVPENTMTPPPNLTPPPVNMTPPPPSMQRNVTPPILQPQVSSAGGAMHAYAQKQYRRMQAAAQGKSPNVTVNPNKMPFTPNVTIQPGSNVITGYTNLMNGYRMAQQPIMNMNMNSAGYITNAAAAGFMNQPQIPMGMMNMNMNMHPQASANFPQNMQPAQANNAVYTTYGYGLTPQAFNMNMNMNGMMRR